MPPEKLYDVVGMGCCAFDIVTEVRRYPGPDEKMAVGGIRTHGGGLVATALVAVARLGGRAVFLGPLGDDYFAQFCVDDFEKEGVETRYIRRVPGKSVVTAIIVACPAEGTRMILSTAADYPRAGEEDAIEDAIAAGRVLHVDNFQPEACLRAARMARRHGVLVTVDLEFDGRREDEFLQVVDYGIVPLAFARRRYGLDEPAEAARRLFDEMAPHGGAAAVVTAGVRGSWAVWDGEEFHQPAFRATVVDTTGCGDVFHGAFALGLARDWDLPAVLRYSSAVAALKCRRLGGRAGIPNAREVGDFLASAETI
jgi:sulfofructose kinase